MPEKRIKTKVRDLIAEIEAEKEAREELEKAINEHITRIDSARKDLKKADLLIKKSRDIAAKWVKKEGDS